MSFSDPIGDMIARIRNGQSAQKATIACPASKLRARVLDVLKDQGFIRGYTEEKTPRGHGQFQIELKYDNGKPMINDMKRVSTPGRRIYRKSAELPRFYNGLGIAIVSTPKGVMSDHEARDQNVGGEVLCQVF